MEIEFLTSGVYAILNIESEKFYIGSAINFKMRWRVHTNELNRNDHKNIHLQNAWNKHGQLKFIFIVLELVEDKYKLIEREQYWIDSLKPTYNILPLAGSRLGMKHTERTKLKMSLNQNRSEETRLRRSISHLGMKQSETQIRNRMLSREGYKHTNETKTKIGKANSQSQLGKIHSAETKAKMSAAKIGKFKSEEAKANMRAAWVLRKQNKNQVLQ